ncbi:helix-turn-helix domain-containing protein [Embleya sp. NPDC005575]|uniref:helix-turn-helix domain-containing protein n=1 Tax=Embleya sp. NPDC005575 TaxID=3156892 RepID=UPI0033B76347
MTETQIQPARQMYDAKTHTVQEIADAFNVGRATIYRHLEKDAPDRTSVNL